MKNKSYKSYKTPLRYPGGKSRAIKRLIVDVPDNFSEFREPFLGGGSMAIEITKRYPDVDIWVNDMYYNLYNFWVQLRDNGDELQKRLLEIKTPIVYETKKTLRPLLDSAYKFILSMDSEVYPSISFGDGLTSAEKKKLKSDLKEKIFTEEVKEKILKHEELFKKAKEEIDNVDDLTKAAYFYILNKCSFSGLGESSSFSEQASEQNFSINGIKSLSEYSELIKDWKITNLDYVEVQNAKGKNCFVFLDPPYDIKDDLYGKNGDMHSGFNHMRFYKDVVVCPHKWMITYNSNEVLRDRFSNFNQMEWDLTYTMRSSKEYVENQKDRKELLIVNYEK